MDVKKDMHGDRAIHEHTYAMDQKSNPESHGSGSKSWVETDDSACIVLVQHQL
jgi:hypothetical protein